MLKLWLILFATIVTFVIPAIGASPSDSTTLVEVQTAASAPGSPALAPIQTQPSEPSALAQVQEKLRSLEQSLSHQKEVVQIIIEAHDKRLSDFGTLAIMQGTQTTWVGNLVVLVSAGIAVLVLAGGLIIYFSVKSRAQTEARTAAQKWFAQNTQKLKNQIQDLQREVEKAHKTIASLPAGPSAPPAPGNTDRLKPQPQTAAADDQPQPVTGIDKDQPAATLSAAALSGADQPTPESQAPEQLQEASQSDKDAAAQDAVAKDAAAKDKPEALPPSTSNAQAALPADAHDASAHVLIQPSFVKTEAPDTIHEGEEEIIVLAELAPRASKIESPDVRAQLARVLVNKGVRLDALGKFEEAIAVSDEIDRRFGKDESSAVHEEVARGLFSKGVRLDALGKFEEAFAVYDEMNQRFNKEEHSPAVREQVARGLFNKGARLGELRKFSEEIAVYDEIDQHFGKDEFPVIRAQVAKGLFNKGFRLGALDKSREAIAVYDEIDRRFGRDESPAVREQVARGLFNKGFRLSALGKSREAIAVYDEIDQRFGKEESAAVRTPVAKALYQAAYTRVICAKQHWHDAGKRSQLLAASSEGLQRALLICTEPDRAILLGSLGYSLFLGGQHDAALAPTREGIKLGGQSSLDTLGSTAQLHRVEPQDTTYEELLAGVALERIEAGQSLTPWIAFQ
jgi:tetratricopeptide (TPR) repeat protein